MEGCVNEKAIQYLCQANPMISTADTNYSTTNILWYIIIDRFHTLVVFPVKNLVKLECYTENSRLRRMVCLQVVSYVLAIVQSIFWQPHDMHWGGTHLAQNGFEVACQLLGTYNLTRISNSFNISA